MRLLSACAGIVGIAAAALGAHVMLTDTRDILPQVYENVQQNAELIEASGGSATVAELDWNEPDDEVGCGPACYGRACRVQFIGWLRPSGIKP